MKFLIELNQDDEERTLALLAGLEEAGLVTLADAILVQTEDEMVAPLLARYGQRLDAPVMAPVPSVSVETPAKKKPGPKPRTVPAPVAAPVAAVGTVPLPAAMPTPVEVHPLTPTPDAPLPPTLARDLRAIVREAGRRAVEGKRMPKEPVKDAHGFAVAPNGTIYTNPLTQKEISYGEMRELLASRRVNPKERYVSNRHGLMEVRDFGKKLKLVKVEATE